MQASASPMRVVRVPRLPIPMMVLGVLALLVLSVLGLLEWGAMPSPATRPVGWPPVDATTDVKIWAKGMAGAGVINNVKFFPPKSQGPVCKDGKEAIPFGYVPQWTSVGMKATLIWICPDDSGDQRFRVITAKWNGGPEGLKPPGWPDNWPPSLPPPASGLPAAP